VKVTYRSSVLGGNTSADIDTALILDFRRAPNVLATLTTVSSEGGGACTAYDGIYQETTEDGCRWDVAKQDFLCAETTHLLETTWSERRGSRWFYLESGADAFPPGANGPRDLGELAQRIARDRSAPRAAFMKQLGTTRLILDLPSTQTPGGKLLLFAAPTLNARLDARFFIVSVVPGRPGVVTQVPTIASLGGRHSARDRVEPDERPLSAFTPDGNPPTYKSSLVDDRSSARVARVLVTEKKGHAVYFVGIEETSVGLWADAFLASSDTKYYDACGTWIVPPAAVSVKVSASPFEAELDVEPGRIETVEEETKADPGAEDRCPTRRTLTWNAGGGFVLDGRRAPASCPAAAPRRVEILADGTVRPRPVEARKP
jgi:hypothetical protein